MVRSQDQARRAEPERLTLLSDFNQVYSAHSQKNTLQGCLVEIAEIYEAETLEISHMPDCTHAPISWPRLRQAFGAARWDRDVFAGLNIYDENSADIELMNAEGIVGDQSNAS